MNRNCYSTHLLRYLFAKLYLACVKRINNENKYDTAGEENAWQEVKHSLDMSPELQSRLKETITQQWSSILNAFGMNEFGDEHQSSESVQNDVSKAYECALTLVSVFMKERQDLSEEEWNYIRNFFKAIGANIVNSK